MYAKTTKLITPSGLHARPASVFVNESKKYKSNVTIRKAEPDAEPKNAKSIVLLLALSLKEGAEIEITAEGEDEVLAVDNLVSLVETGLGE